MAVVWGGTTRESSGRHTVSENRYAAWRSLFLVVAALMSVSLLVLGATH